MGSFRGYDGFASDFLRHAESGAFNALYDRPAVLAAVGDVAGRRVLDLGCGPGLYAAELVNRGARVVGVDQSPQMVALARQQAPQHACFRVHDLHTPMDWADDGSFDVAVMALVIHHLDDRETVLAEVHRVLVPGGRLVVSTHHPLSDWDRHGGSYFTVEAVEEVWQSDWHVRYWRQPLSHTIREFRDAGFVLEQLIEPEPSDELRIRYPDVHQSLSRLPAFIVFSLVKSAIWDVETGS